MYPKMSAPAISVKVPGSMNMRPAMIMKILSSEESGLLKKPIIPAERAITPKSVEQRTRISVVNTHHKSGVIKRPRVKSIIDESILLRKENLLVLST